jgi:hypothetical protein
MPLIITKTKEEKNLGPIDKLPKTKSKNGYAYTLVKRNDKAAIYSMVNEKYPEDKSVSYEVFKIVVNNPATIMQKSGSKKGMWYQYPRTEKFPGNEDFGIIAWSADTLEGAEKRYKELSK